jgi:hypothetical protein
MYIPLRLAAVRYCATETVVFPSDRIQQAQHPVLPATAAAGHSQLPTARLHSVVCEQIFFRPSSVLTAPSHFSLMRHARVSQSYRPQ